MVHLFEEHVDGVIVFHVSGSLTMTNLVAAAAEAHFGGLGDREGAHVVVDIGGVDAVTSHAMTLMLRTVWAVKERGGMMVFANPTPDVRRIFARCGLDIVLYLATAATT